MNIDNMFSCQSFLYLSKKAARALDNIPASGFISIHDTEALRKIAKYIGYEDIEGAILLDYYDQHILTLHEWDYIDVLWNNMAESVDECCTRVKQCAVFGNVRAKYILSPMQIILSRFIRIGTRKITGCRKRSFSRRFSSVPMNSSVV